MTRQIRLSAPLYRRLRDHLLQDDGLERVAYLFAGHSAGPHGLVLTVRDLWPVPLRAFVPESPEGLQVQPGYIKSVLQHCREIGCSLIEAHSHPSAGRDVTFSPIDLRGEARTFPYVAARLPGIHHGSLVLSHEGLDAHLYDTASQMVLPIDGVQVLDAPRQWIVPTSASPPASGGDGESAGRYHRQIMLFGSAGQQVLGRLTVGLAGLGSVGMLYAQQLVYLGVRHFVLVDPDVVELSNLNRLVGALPSDAVQGTLKVEVARRLIQSVAPEAQVQALPLSVLQTEAYTALKCVDVLFGAVDNHGARLVLNNRLAVQYLIPYIDVGTGFETDAAGRIVRAGGLVRTVLPGQWCLNCIDALDREAAKLDLLSPIERARARAHGYISQEPVPAPAVIFLNSTLASLAIAEFMNLLAGFKPIQPLISYDLLKARAIPLSVAPRAGCTACSSDALLALGDLEPFPRYDLDVVLPSPDALDGRAESETPRMPLSMSAVSADA